jgi:hypothetical protein
MYPTSHWAVVERRRPTTPDEDVFLEGRNIVLIASGRALRTTDRTFMMGPLAGNPS